MRLFRPPIGHYFSLLTFEQPTSFLILIFQGFILNYLESEILFLHNEKRMKGEENRKGKKEIITRFTDMNNEGPSSVGVMACYLSKF